MNRLLKFKFILAMSVLGAALHAPSAPACAACFGRATGPLADGLNWGIFVLMTFILSVLGGIASFFIFIARRAASTTAMAAGAAKLPPNELNAATLKA